MASLPPIIAAERVHSINGVDGRYMGATVGGRNYKPGTFTMQRWKAGRHFRENDGARGYDISIEIRFDDDCRNGHNTFAITGEIKDCAKRGEHAIVTCGSIHDDIAKHFPELAPLLKWHLTSADGPMHYVSNAVYHASDRDHNGLLKGETRQLRNGRTGQLCWQLAPVGADPLDTIPMHRMDKTHEGEADSLPPVPVLEWRPWNIVGEGKERRLDYARSTAVWPDATDEQLTAEPAVLRQALQERLPALIAAFRQDIVQTCGFLWEPPPGEVTNV